MLILYAAAAVVAVPAAAAAAVAEGRAEEVRWAGGRWGMRAKKKQGGRHREGSWNGGAGGAQVRVARNDSEAGASWARESERRELEGERDQKKRAKEKQKNAYHIKPTPDRPPLAAVMLCRMQFRSEIQI